MEGKESRNVFFFLGGAGEEGGGGGGDTGVGSIAFCRGGDRRRRRWRCEVMMDWRAGGCYDSLKSIDF